MTARGMKRLYWRMRERMLSYQLHQTYMSISPSGCDCRDCRHARALALGKDTT